MQLLFLGTGASEGLPSLFCCCRVCEEARKSGGRDLRRRSSVLIDDDLLIDLTPDLSASCDACKCSVVHLSHLFVTHEHFDHFYPAELWNMVPPYVLTERTAPLQMYGNQKVLDSYERVLPPERRAALPLRFHVVRDFEPVQAGDFKVLPLSARHCPGALIYLITKEDKTILYATDTGYFPEKTWDVLAGIPIDLAIFDCNNPLQTETPNHMSIEDAITAKRRLFQIGCAKPDIRYYVTHISHNGGMNHREIEERLLIHGFRAATDGLRITI